MLTTSVVSHAFEGDSQVSAASLGTFVQPSRVCRNRVILTQPFAGGAACGETAEEPVGPLKQFLS